MPIPHSSSSESRSNSLPLSAVIVWNKGSYGFEYIRLPIPEGYRITEEVKTFEDYDITMEDDAGHMIYYLQMEPDSSSLDLFNEKERIQQTEISGRNAVISHNGDMHSILIEDGKYAYLVEGECDYDTLLDIVKKLMGG